MKRNKLLIQVGIVFITIIILVIIRYDGFETFIGLKKAVKQNNVTLELPKFKYYPDPLGSGDIIKYETICPVCNQKREYKYIGPFLSKQGAEGICPWCIADGSAAKKYQGSFQLNELCEEVSNKKFKNELLYRTPGYRAWLLGSWPSHCGDYCIYFGSVGWNETKDITELKGTFDNIRRKAGLTQPEFEETFVKEGYIEGHLFRCSKCGKYRLLAYSINEMY